MFQDTNFFLCLLVKSFFVPNNLQSDVSTKFVVEHFHDLSHNKAVLLSNVTKLVKIHIRRMQISTFKIRRMRR